MKQTVKATIKRNGKIEKVNSLCNNTNTWVLYKGEWYKNLNGR
jgi:hypothetical protein